MQELNRTWARWFRSKSVLRGIPLFTVAGRPDQHGQTDGRPFRRKQVSPAEKGESVQNKNGGTALHGTGSLCFETQFRQKEGMGKKDGP